MKKPRDYRKATEYEERPEQVKHREERNRARALLAKTSGKALSGDVGHIKPLKAGGSNTPGNVHVESIAKNRGWRKGQRGYHVPTEKK
jgi:hypothetical protein